MKEAPSADGQTGGVVAGVSAVEGETVGNKLADTRTLDAGVPDVTTAEPLGGMLLDGLEMPGIAALEKTEDADAGVLDG